jgi:hypothetical protein
MCRQDRSWRASDVVQVRACIIWLIINACIHACTYVYLCTNKQRNMHEYTCVVMYAGKQLDVQSSSTAELQAPRTCFLAHGHWKVTRHMVRMLLQ